LPTGIKSKLRSEASKWPAGWFKATGAEGANSFQNGTVKIRKEKGKEPSYIE